MADRTLPNPVRGCGTLKRGTAYIRGTIGSPAGTLPSFVELDPYVPYREMGTDGGFTRGFLKFDGVSAQFALDDITDFVRRYPGDADDQSAVENMIDAGLYGTDDGAAPATHVPGFEGQRHVDRIRYRGTSGDDHFGAIDVANQSDLLMRAGKTHYPDPDDFIEEAVELGISKAIPMSQNQQPPVVEPGITRCWILHPDTDVGWAIIGYAYLQEVVYTEPADDHVPQYVQDYASAGRLDVVDIEPAPGDNDSGPNATVSDYADSSDPVPSAPSDPAADADADGDADVDADVDADTVVPAEGDTNADAQTASQALQSADDLGYNDLKAAASFLDLDVGQHPGADALAEALADAGLTPNDIRGMADADERGGENQLRTEGMI